MESKADSTNRPGANPQPVRTKQILRRRRREDTKPETTADPAFRLFWSNPHPMWVYDLATLRFLEVNAAAITQYGFSRQEFLTMSILDIRPEEDRPVVCEAMRRVGESLHHAGIWRHRTRTGELRWVEIMSHPIAFRPRSSDRSSKTRVERPRAARMVTAINVTERRRLDNALRESHAMLASVVEGTPNGIFVKDSEGRYLLVNSAAARFFRVAPEDLLGKRDVDLFPEYLIARIKQSERPVLENGENVAYEVRQPITRNPPEPGETDDANRVLEFMKFPYWRYGTEGKIGKVGSADDSPAADIRGVVGVIRDITAQRQAEAEAQRLTEDLKANAARFEAVVEGLNEGILLTDFEDHILFANQRMSELCGYTREEMVGALAYELLLPPERWPKLLERNSNRAQGVTETYETTLWRKDGTQFEGLINASPFRNAQGEIIGTLGAITDITERKRAQEEKERLHAALAAAAERQRQLLRDVLFSLTEGRLHLCDSEAELPELPGNCKEAEIAPLPRRLPLTQATLGRFRQRVRAALRFAGIAGDRASDLVLAAGEASMNAVVHATTGEGWLVVDRHRRRVQVWVRDRGTGILEEALHRATLERGFSSTGTLGYGFWVILSTCERIWLLTGPAGTTLVLEQSAA